MPDLWDEIWDGIEDAEIFERGKYFHPGFVGVVRMKRTIGKLTRKSGPAFIVEMEVVESKTPDIHPVGFKGTWYQSLKDLDVAFPAILAWVLACSGLDPTKDKEVVDKEIRPQLQQLMKEARANPDDNFFINIRCHLETLQTTTVGKGLPFTRYEFSPAAQE